jgi:biotin transport system permease protein
MAEVTFHYVNTFTLFHRADPRTKVAMLLTLSITGGSSRWPGLCLLIPSIVAALIAIRLPAGILLRELRGFAILFLLIIVASVIDTGGADGAFKVSLDPGGFSDGLLLVTRMIAVLLIAVFFTGTTKTREMRDAVWWLLRPVPFINHSRVAAMFSLTIRFIPLIFDESAKIRMGLAARGTVGRPLRRIRLLGIPLILNTFRRVDAIAKAMISRCYSDEAVRPTLGFGGADAAMMAGGAALVAGVVLMNRVIASIPA